ncbi:alcohol dehydrogenase catalytic domain-containing protein [Pelagibacteraceae bacterium]|nr:alcohol dehydrogenase catalytic domain-containing protein [Pelagibacteraceae bacterium]
MHALVYTGTQELVYREEKNPKIVSGESIVKVSASGICGSDMHAYHGKDNRRIPPLILGHEISGTIDKGNFAGKKVILNPLITCGKCDYCTNGKEHLCDKRIILGMNRPIERQGGFAEYVSIPDQNIYELPKTLEINQAPIAEPTAVALHAVELGEKELFKNLNNSKVLIIGGGAIGLLSGLILSKVKKCKEIVIVDPNEKRLEECSKYLDADPVKPNSKSIIIDHFDIVFDTVGMEITRQQAIKVVKPGGVIIHVGLTQPSGQFDFRKATLQEITFIGTYCYTNKDFEKTLKILSNKEIGSLDWIEYRKLQDGAAAFQQIHDNRCAAPKIILLI